MRFIHMAVAAATGGPRAADGHRWADSHAALAAQTDGETIALRWRREGEREREGDMDRLLKCLSLVW